MTKKINNPSQFAEDVYNRVKAYKGFLDKEKIDISNPFQILPLLTKQNYLLQYDINDLCWDNTLGNCHLIGSSSGLSGKGSVFWPKRPEDETNYMEAIEKMLSKHYNIDKKKTLILCCMALGTWLGGMTITATLRVLAAKGKLPITVCTPGLNLAEAVEVYSKFHAGFEQTLWITNPSSINLIYALIKKKNINILPAKNYFAVVGEYYPEEFRENIALKFGFPPEEKFVVWTGYGAADTGDLGVETTSTIDLRKFINKNKSLSERIFGTSDTPMILALNDEPYIEIVNGQIVATKDQLVPLVRYNTGDAGGILEKEMLKEIKEIPPEVIEPLNERMLFVYGRVSDSIIFYGTNLNVKSIHAHFLTLSESYCYAGLFQVSAKDIEGVSTYHFTVFTTDYENEILCGMYKEVLINYLRHQSLEFSTKFTQLSASAGTELITVGIDDINKLQGNIKHKFII